MSQKSGFILIKKPKGITSHDVVNILRKITNVKKVGHAGTLDPLASGLLILGVGREATKKLSLFQKADKEYVATLKLGAVSDTLDKEGHVEQIEVKKIPKRKDVKAAIKKFIGKIQQIPPVFSAKKIRGEKFYELARKGIKVQPKPQEVTIYQILILQYDFPFLKIKVKCSSGTYLRSLAFDIGKALGCGAYLEDLVRTKIGRFSVKNAVELSDLNSDNWQEFLFDLK